MVGLGLAGHGEELHGGLGEACLYRRRVLGSGWPGSVRQVRWGMAVQGSARTVWLGRLKARQARCVGYMAWWDLMGRGTVGLGPTWCLEFSIGATRLLRHGMLRSYVSLPDLVSPGSVWHDTAGKVGRTGARLCTWRSGWA